MIGLDQRLFGWVGWTLDSNYKVGYLDSLGVTPKVASKAWHQNFKPLMRGCVNKRQTENVSVSSFHILSWPTNKISDNDYKKILFKNIMNRGLEKKIKFFEGL